ncbi:uncharacterized protein LOC125205194 [Salvia hispanica]|uniref:uncharacterized protein LOC125205194 n=1 Tax=Salvia hispanica TaxID=49212 RepID=UPI002009B7D3|nr:uncharacterized protein LOC125205194 [Salvia hispanica]
MGGHLLSLYPATQASRLKRLTSSIPFSTIRRFKHGREGQGIDKERAPTTAEEFERVAEEKSRQGFSSQTVEKASDGALEAAEAAVGDSNPQAVKEAFKEPTGKGDFHKGGVHQR